MTKSQFITKQEALEILGWHMHPVGGMDKLQLLRRNGLLSKPAHAPRMYVRREVENVLFRLSKDLVIQTGKNNYELRIHKAA